MNTSRNAWIPRLKAWKGRIGRHSQGHGGLAAEPPAGLSTSPRHIDIPSPPGGEATAVASDDPPASPAQAGPPREGHAAAAAAVPFARAGDRILDGPARTSNASPAPQGDPASSPRPAAPPAPPAVVTLRATPALPVAPPASKSWPEPDSTLAAPTQAASRAEPAVGPTHRRTLDLFAETPPAPGPRTSGQADVPDGHAAGREFMNTSFDSGVSDLSRTNELLEQLLAETRKRSVAYLPASGPGWNR